MVKRKKFNPFKEWWNWSVSIFLALLAGISMLLGVASAGGEGAVPFVFGMIAFVVVFIVGFILSVGITLIVQKKHKKHRGIGGALVGLVIGLVTTWVSFGMVLGGHISVTVIIGIITIIGLPILGYFIGKKM